MKFIYPAFLFALFFIAIPILIHLFSFRRFTTVYFSDVSYLFDIKRESQRKSRLKNLLILISRILALSMLVFAFAQPYFPADKNSHKNPDPVISVYIDNSFSMNALSPQGQLLETARNKALEIATAYPPGTRFRILTNDLLPQHFHDFNKEQFIQQVSEIKVSSKSVPLSQIANRIGSGNSGAGPKDLTVAFYLSDFQKSTSDLHSFKNDSNTIHYFWPLSPNTTGNIFIDSCWMEIPAHRIGQEEKLFVKIVNSSEESYQNLPVKFFLNDSLKALANCNADAGAETVVELSYINRSSGIHSGYVEIQDYPFTHDNTYYISFIVQPHLKALAIYDASYGNESGLPYIRALFEGDDFVQFDAAEAGNLQVSRLAGFHVIFILNVKELSSGLINELNKAALNGATVVFLPELEGKTDSYNNFLSMMNANRITGIDTAQQQIAGLEWEHPVYRTVFTERSGENLLPVIHGTFIFSKDIRIPETNLLWFRNQLKAISIQALGEGNLVVFSFPLSKLNNEFARDLLFVPTIYSLVINSLPPQQLSYMIGKDPYALLPRGISAGNTSLSVAEKMGNNEFIPEISYSEGNRMKIYFSGYFETAGHYTVNSENLPLTVLSLNYNRDESKLDFFKAEELISQIKKYSLLHTEVIHGQSESSAIIGEIQGGKKLWKYFLILALAFLVTEAAIIRFLK